MKRHVMLFVLAFTLGIAIAQEKSARPAQGKNLFKDIPYQEGPKDAAINLVEQALSKHPMLAGAVQGVIRSTRRCELFQYSLKKRSRDERLSTQFNGGELKAEFVYFCFRQAKAERSQKDDEDAGPEMADVVLTIRGDVSQARVQIMDPEISYSRCYGHFCGSN